MEIVGTKGRKVRLHSHREKIFRVRISLSFKGV